MFRPVLCLMFLSAFISFAAPHPAASMEVGSGLFTLPEASCVDAEPIRVFHHRPAGWKVDGPILIVLHGVNRDADRYLAEWRDLAEAANVLVICPEFTMARYPGARWYNLGNVVERERGGVLRHPDAWTFGVVDRVFVDVRRRTGALRESFALFGHSAGAQFVHRYALLAKGSAASPIIVANAGWYTMPNADIAFPYGLGGLALGDEALSAALKRPVTILLGDQDIDPAHPSLRRNPEADVQGLHRFERGHAFFAQAGREAARLKSEFRWRLRVAPEVAHENAGMARAAIDIVAGR